MIPTVAEHDDLEYFVGRKHPEELFLRLYANDHTPAEGDTAADYQEAKFAGYAPIPLRGILWSKPNNLGIVYPRQTFTCAAGEQDEKIRGYYLTRAKTGTIAAAERFSDGPYAVETLGTLIHVTPTITKRR